MSFKVSKSSVLRIGKSYNNACSCITVHGKCLQYTCDVKYLGVHVVTGKSFKLSLHAATSQFYKAVNGVLSKCQNKNNDIVLLKLIVSYCKPLLVYATECTGQSNSVINT